LVVLPEDAAERLRSSLEEEPLVTLGKSRSVRGLGRLRALREEGLPDEWRTVTPHTVLVVQSPLLLPDLPAGGATAEEELYELAAEWARTHELPEPQRDRTWANVGLRFGWNRTDTGFQRACRVALPGSVIAWDGKLDEQALAPALIAGLGTGGRERGYGAASVHPGKATGLYPDRDDPPLPHLAAEPPDRLRNALQLVLALRCGGQRLPSPSQIRAVQQRLVKSGAEAALAYLDRQTQRTSRIWYTWESIHGQIAELLREHDPQLASRALEVLANLAIYDQKEEQRA